MIGRLCAGNRNGLLVPSSTSDSELQHLRDSLPDSVRLERIEERISELGNVIACNDYCALVHPDLDNETEEIIRDVLGVEVFRRTVANNDMVGACTVLTSSGGLVHPNTSTSELDELHSLLQLPVVAGTINHGSEDLSAGMTANDVLAFCGMGSTSQEIFEVETLFRYNR